MDTLLLKYYESAAKIMAQMLVAASANVWEKVSELEHSYMVLLDNIKQLERQMKAQGQRLSPAQARDKQALIQRILADDGEIRNLLYPVMHRITDMIFDAQLHARMPPDMR